MSPILRRWPLIVVVLLAFPAVARPVLAQLPRCVTGCGGGTYSVSVSPDGAGIIDSAGTYDASFTVFNKGTLADTYSFSCSATGGITCIGISPPTMSINPGVDENVTVTYSVGATGGSLTLTATGNASDAGSYVITLLAPPAVGITSPVGSGGRVVVHNRQPVLRAIYRPGSYAVDSTAISLTWRGTDATTLARFNHGLLEWEVDSAHWLGIGDSAQAIVRVCDVYSHCGQASLWVVLLNDHKPVIGLNTLPLEAPGVAFGAPFGPGLAVQGGDVGTGFSTPAYTSRGSARSAGLVYSTRTSYPRALLPIEVELPWPNGAISKLHVTLLDGATRLDSVVVTSPSNSCVVGPIRRCRVGLQANFASGSYATPVRKWLTVQVQVDSGGTTNLANDSLEVVVVDRRQAVYGKGWWPAGVSQLVAAGSDRVVVGPDGTAAIYRGFGDSLYLAPPGVFTVLKRVGNTWELHPRGTLAKAVFDSLGRLVRNVDPHGNADTVVYSGTTTQVTALADPLGHRMTFGYTSGKLSTITDPGSRVTKVGISAANQLTADTLPSANGHTYFTTYAYQIYSDSGLLLTKRAGVLADTTVITYDSTVTRRPTKVTLAAVDTGGGSAKPVIQYIAAEAIGFHDLANPSAALVTVTDPKGNWTVSQVNRWGAARTTWDVLDTLARTSYTPEGLVQWTEGKIPDSSRVTSVYDARRHLVKTYMVRALGDTVRLDSLVYDASTDHVTASVDARGQVSTVSYDTYGDVTSTRGPFGNVTTTWFGSTGLVDSSLAPGNTHPTRLTYDTTWKNLATVTDPNGDLVSQSYYDSFGRDTATDAKLRVQLTATSSSWQWRRTETFFNPLNQADSNRLLRTASCPDPCGTRPPWPSPSDTTATIRVGYRYDRAGRDSLRLGDRGAATGHGVLYLYDVLGRLRSRHPWWPDSTVVRDSFVVDVAGNVTKIVTRRGDTLRVAFDSRNRDTSAVIPGVGTLHHVYAGPSDQLTREYYTNYVDSIGGVNATRAWVFDRHGRTLVDTAFTGSTARVTTYAYDHFDRDTLFTDAVGNWRTGYETARGYPDTLFAGTGDTVFRRFDGQGRPVAVTLNASGAAPFTTQATFNDNGDLKELDNAIGGASPFNPGSWINPLFASEIGPPLAPIWTFNQDLPDTLYDSTAYDGWERVATWTETDNFHSRVTESYTYDRDGNIASGANETYDPLTDRLISRTSSCGTATYAYDRAGNLIQKSCGGHTWTYGYDALNELRSLRYDGTLISRYAYDAEGRRIAKRVYASTTGGTVVYLRFYYHGANVAFETDSAGTLGQQYVWVGTDHLVAWVDGSGNHFSVVTDMLGDVRALAGRDGSPGGVADYAPYGSGAGLSTLRYGWTGREYDPELGWYYFRARYYDLGARRFVQEDPAGYGAGVNVYAYGNGSPLQGTDPTGMIFNPENVFNFNVDESVNAGQQYYLDGAPFIMPGGGVDPFAAGAVSVFDGTSLQALAGFTDWDILTNSERNYTGSVDFYDKEAKAAFMDLKEHAFSSDDAALEGLIDGAEFGSQNILINLGVQFFDKGTCAPTPGCNVPQTDGTILIQILPAESRVEALHLDIPDGVVLAHELGHVLQAANLPPAYQNILNPSGPTEGSAFYYEDRARAAYGCVPRTVPHDGLVLNSCH